MSRVRLTQRNAADMSIPYPGNVNQPDRKDPSWDEYHTFEQQVNHELPDMRHEWKDNPRDDIGFGIPDANPPTVASIRVAANKAVRIAVLLLGEKVDDEVVEAQARDLMAMSGDAMDRTLSRFADTQKLYAEDKEEDDKDSKKAKRVWDKDEKKWVESADKDEDKDEKKAEDKKEDEDKKEASAALVKKDDKKAEDKVEDKKEEKPVEVKAEDKKEVPEFIQKKIDESKEKKSAEKDEKKAEDKKEDGKDVEKKAEDKAEEKEEKKAGINELNIELTGAADEEVEPDPEADKQLASLFDDGFTAVEEEKDEEEVKSSKKAGIKKLGGQPKVASTSGESVDISSIWESAPDVSQVFK